MSALVGADSPRERMDVDAIAAAMGNLLVVDVKLEKHPSEASIENCERTLKTAAGAIMQLWGDVQREKARRVPQARELTPA